MLSHKDELFNENDIVLVHPENPLQFAVVDTEEDTAEFGGVKFVLADEAKRVEIEKAVDDAHEEAHALNDKYKVAKLAERAALVDAVEAATGDAKVDALLALQNFDAGITGK